MSTRDDRPADPGEPGRTGGPDAPGRRPADPHGHHEGGRHEGGGEHLRAGHDRSEGEYDDKDVTGDEPRPEPVGSYVDRDVTAHQQDHVPDEGEYTDRDEPAGSRHVHEDSYTDVDPRRPHPTGSNEERDDTHG